MKTPIIAAVLAVATTTAHASPSWPQEPVTSFLGIKWGTQLTESLPECDNRLGPQDQKKLCYHQLGHKFYQVAGLPELGLVKPKLIVLTWGGGVKSFILESKTDDFDKMKEMLVTRYGQPISTGYQTVNGISTYYYKWEGEIRNIMLLEHMTVRTCGVMLVNLVADMYERANPQQEAKDAADKL